MIACGNGFVVYAEQFVPSGLTAVILATSPFWMVGVESMLPGGERPGPGAIAGLLVGFAGIVLLVWPDLQAGGAHATRFALGILALQMACAAWALGSAYSKRHKHGEDVVGATAVQMLFGGAIMAVVATIFGEWHWLTFTARSATAFAYLVVAGSLGGFLAYIYALRHLPVSTVSLYAYVNPVIAVVLGAAALGEPFGLRVVASAGLVLAGSAFVRSSGNGSGRSGSAAKAARGHVASLVKRVTS
jgi:drug/metabolite transporter (DMT)-like permease